MADNTKEIQSEKETFYSHFQYDKVRKCHYINARKLYDLMGLTKLPYHNVTDTMISNYLDSESFICTMDGNLKRYKDTLENHAQRIASLIDLIRKDTQLHAVTIFYDSPKKIEIDDGLHRMRASYYLNENLTCQLDVE